MALNTIIEIQDLGATHTLPPPNEYEETYFRASVVGVNAVGKPFVQALGGGLYEFRLTWHLMTDAQMLLVQQAWDGLSSQVCRYEGLFSETRNVTRHEDQESVQAVAVKTAAGIRWRVSIHLQSTTKAYEI